MNWLSSHFLWIIGGCAAVHTLIFAGLLWVRGRKTKKLVYHLGDLVRGFSSHSDTDRSVDNQINMFLLDLQDVVQNPARYGELEALRTRLVVKDETRPYLQTTLFERFCSVSRALIEIYPLLGIIGTVLAIGCGLSSSANAPPESGAAVDAVVQNFSQSIWATGIGLACAVFWMLMNAWFEPSFQRLLEHQASVRGIITAAKCRLGGASPPSVSPLGLS